MKRVGLLGGAFDPVHIGHLSVAEAVQSELELDEIWFLPSGNHRFKEEFADFDSRQKWLTKAVANCDKFKVVDFDKGDGDVSYTAELIRKISSLGHKYYFIIGEDNVAGLGDWYDIEWLLENIQFVVVSRKNRECWKGINYLNKLVFIDMDLVEISSSQIRKNPKGYASFIPEQVREEIVNFYENVVK